VRVWASDRLRAYSEDLEWPRLLYSSATDQIAALENSAEGVDTERSCTCSWSEGRSRWIRFSPERPCSLGPSWARVLTEHASSWSAARGTVSAQVSAGTCRDARAIEILDTSGGAPSRVARCATDGATPTCLSLDRPGFLYYLLAEVHTVVCVAI